MSAAANIKITAKNETKTGFKSAENELSKFGQSVNNIGSKIKGALSFAAVAVGLQKLGSACKECFNEFNDAERKYKKLGIAVKGNQQEFNKLTTSITKLSKQTLQSKGDVENMVSQLAAMGKSSDEVDKVASAAVALSNVTGKDLSTSMQALINSTTGVTTTLKRMGIDTTELTSAQLKSGGAIDLVIEKYGEYSEALAKGDVQQSLKNINDMWGDIKQSMGAAVKVLTESAIMNAEGGLNGAMDKINDTIANIGAGVGVVGSVVGSVVGILKTAFGSLTTLVTTNFNAMDLGVNLITTSLTGLFKNFAPKVQGFFSRILAILNALPSTCSALFTAIWKTLKETFDWENVKLIFTTIGSNIAEVWSDTLNFITKSTPEALKGLWDGIVNKVKYISLTVKATFQDVFGVVSKWATGIFTFIGDAFRATFKWDNIKAVFTTMFSNIGTCVTDLFKFIKDKLPTVLSELTQGIKYWFIALGLQLKQKLLTAVQEVINKGIEKVNETGLAQAIAFITNKDQMFKEVDFAASNSTKEQLKNTQEEMQTCFDNMATTWSKGIENIGASIETKTGDVIADIYKDAVSTLNATLAKDGKYSAETRIAAKEANANATKAFAAAATVFRTGINKIGTNTQAGSIAAAFDSVYGETWKDFVAQMETIAAQTVEDSETLKDAMNSTDTTWEKIQALLEKVAGEGSPISGLATAISDATTTFPELKEKILSAITFNDALKTGVVPETADAPVSFWEELKADFLNGFDGIWGMTKDKSTELVSAFSGVIGMSSSLTECLGYFNQIMNPLNTILQGFMDEIGEVLIECLKPLAEALKAVGRILASPIMGVLTSFAVVIKFITGTIQWACDWINYGVKKAFSFGFANVSKPGSYESYTRYGYEEQSAAVTDATTTSSTQTSVATAKYSGGNHITINVYQQGVIVGDNGIRQFASMIKEEFDNSSYFGVA